MSSGAQSPSRLIGVAVNPLWGMLPKSPQKAIYNQGQHNAPGFEGGKPTWCVAEFLQVQPYDTVDSMLDLPDAFTLLTIMAISYQHGSATRGAFAFELYDVNREQWLFEKIVRSNTRAGDGASTGGTPAGQCSPPWEKAPYSFVSQNAQCTVRVSEIAGNVTDIQLILFGVQGGA